MKWEASTDQDTVDSGATIDLDRGYHDYPPQPGETIRIVNRTSGRSVEVTVVSSNGDRLEVSDGERHVAFKSSSGRRPATLDESGRYFETWTVV